MDSSLDNSTNNHSTKAKPKVGDIRLAADGIRCKIFSGKGWRYLSKEETDSQTQSKAMCPSTESSSNNHAVSVDKSSSNKVERPKTGDIQKLSNGARRIWRGDRWQRLCRADDCSVQASDLCKIHQNQRMSLPNMKRNSPSTNRVRSNTIDNEIENEQCENIESKDTGSPEISNSKRHRLHNESLETIALSPTKKCELHTRNGRRVRCNGLIWKHLCADKRSVQSTSNNQQQDMPTESAEQNKSNHVLSSSSDNIDASNEINCGTKRKTTDDSDDDESVDSKKKTNEQLDHGGSDKLIASHLEMNSSVSDISTSDESMDIPYELSTSAIIEQFGTILKSEEDEEVLFCVSSVSSDAVASPCETLQDFIRIEDMKKKSFLLDCQRIGYRLAKIQDCIGNLSSMTSS